MGGEKKFLFIVQQPAYGNELAFNALRLAMNLIKRHSAQVQIFFTGDGVTCARRGQETPDGYYNLDRMVRYLAQNGEVAT